jgi:hypothetical protein
VELDRRLDLLPDVLLLLIFGLSSKGLSELLDLSKLLDARSSLGDVCAPASMGDERRLLCLSALLILALTCWM